MISGISLVAGPKMGVCHGKLRLLLLLCISLYMISGISLVAGPKMGGMPWKTAFTFLYNLYSYI